MHILFRYRRVVQLFIIKNIKLQLELIFYILLIVTVTNY